MRVYSIIPFIAFRLFEQVWNDISSEQDNAVRLGGNELNKTDSNKIGICIPTYNRSLYLKECLESITSEVIKFGFPIYISDNCSDDDTNNVIDSYKQRYWNLRYSRNLSNVGPYKNILKLIEIVKTEYLWLMGDDDAILPESVQKIIEKLNRGYDFLVLNATPCDKNLKPKISKEKLINIDSDLEIGKGDSQKLLVTLRDSSYHGYMSSMIIRTELVQKLVIKYCNKSFLLYDSSWLPLAIFYEAITNSQGLFISQPMILNRDNTRTSGKNYWNYIYIDYIKAIEYLGSVGYNTQTLKESLNFTVRNVFYIAKFSKYLSHNTKLFDNYIKKNNLMPFYIKLVIIATDLIYSRHFMNIRNKLLKNFHITF